MHLILDVKTTFKLLKTIVAKTFDGNTIKMKVVNAIYVVKKAMFLVVSPLDVHFDFERPFYACPIGRL